ncbi:MAG: hypothetical protein RTV72_03790 [Candidatus Thorarchaeota archaeon]
MPKKKKKISTITVLLIVVLLVAVVSVTAVAWHDGKIGATPLSSINDGSVVGGTLVTVRGTITGIISGLLVTINDGTGSIAVEWADTASLTLHSLVVVRATVNSFHALRDTTSIETVWLFA